MKQTARAKDLVRIKNNVSVKGCNFYLEKQFDEVIDLFMGKCPNGQKLQ
jgi:hypothetical protein